MRALLLGHAGVTLAMVGVIWTIQVVHYPLFSEVGAETWSSYHAGHTARISLVVIPLMLGEVALTGALLWQQTPQVPPWSVWLGAALLVVIWGSTFFWQVPLHGALSQGSNLDLHEALVRSNWLRTVAWTGRAGLALWWLR